MRKLVLAGMVLVIGWLVTVSPAMAGTISFYNKSMKSSTGSSICDGYVTYHVKTLYVCTYAHRPSIHTYSDGAKVDEKPVASGARQTLKTPSGSKFHLRVSPVRGCPFANSMRADYHSTGDVAFVQGGTLSPYPSKLLGLDRYEMSSNVGRYSCRRSCDGPEEHWEEYERDTSGGNTCRRTFTKKRACKLADSKQPKWPEETNIGARVEVGHSPNCPD